MSGESQNDDTQLQKDNIATRVQIKERPKSPRDLLLEDLDSRIEEQRNEDDEYFYQSGDPRAIAMAAAMRAEGDPNTRVDHNGRTLPPRDLESGQFVADAGAEGDPYPEGNADVERDDAAAAAAKKVQPKNGVDPLEEYVVRQAGKPPMFKATINGQVKLIPLEAARRQLQVGLEADRRLEEATARRKELDARERKLQTDEAAAVKRRALQPPATPINEAELDAEATELVRSLVSDPEATAAKKLAKVLGKIRASQPQIDTQAIVRHAASVAKEEIAVDANNKALVTGLAKFHTDYQDIVADPELYKLADAKTDAIAKEHPEWAPEKVMSEAGNQVREWVAKVSGKKLVAKIPPTGDPSRRQAIKQRLTPMPQARSVRPAAEASDANADDSPSDYLADIRKARGMAS